MRMELHEAWVLLGYPTSSLEKLMAYMEVTGLSIKDAWDKLGFAPKMYNAVKYKMLGATFAKGQQDLMKSPNCEYEAE